MSGDNVQRTPVAVRQEATRRRRTSRNNAQSVAYELFIIALSISSLMVLVGYFFLPLSAVTKQALCRIDLLFSLAFIFDSFRSLFRAPDKWAYLKWGWLDFLGSVPLIVPLRFLRVARLVRAWRTVRTRRVGYVRQEFRQDQASGVLLVMYFVAVVAFSISTLFVLEAEYREPGSNIRTGEDAFWWAVATITTVGYGDRYPITFGGRLAAFFLMSVGIGLFGAMTSYLASRFVMNLQEESEDGYETGQELAELRDDLAALELRLREVTVLLEQLSRLPDNRIVREEQDEGIGD